MKRLILIAAALISFGASFVTNIHGAPEDRFDYKVRQDFFAGFTGEKEAMARGMKTTEAILAENPNHAEALVWHGAGVYSGAREAFQSGDREKGMQLIERGLQEMDKAVALAPESVGVRIPRGATLLTSARMMPPQIGEPLIRKGLDDYLSAMRVQNFAELGEHPRGELLQGLGDGYSRLGEKAKAEEYYGRILREMAGSPYAKRAAKWMETKEPLPPAQAMCIGCHVK